MLEQESSNAEKASHVATQTSTSTHSLMGHEEWWNIPTGLAPPPPNPAIHSLDPHEVGAASAPMGGNVHIVGMGNAASTQVGPSRATLIQQADGDRGLAMNAQLQLAAKTLESVTAKIFVVLNTAPDERGPSGVLQQLEALVAEGQHARTNLNTVATEKFASSAMKEGTLHVSRATREFYLAVEEVKKYARSHQLSVGTKTTAAFVQRDAFHLETSMQLVDADTSKVGKVDESKTALESVSLRESLDGLLHSAQALMMAVHETAPETAVKEVMPSLLSSQRMLDASLIDGIKPTPAMQKQGQEIVRLVDTAYKTASAQLKADGGFTTASAAIPRSIARLEKLAKAKK